MTLDKMLAKACVYSQEHIDDKEAWSTDAADREDHLQCTSYMVACFLSQNTRDGDAGVDWDVVLLELVEHPMKSEEAWAKIINDKAESLGGWNCCP